MNQQMDWQQPVFVGDTVRVEAFIDSVSEGAQTLKLRLQAKNQKSETVMTGSAQVKLAARVAELPGQTIREKFALVTGGSRGIGAAIATALARNGHRVAITYHSNSPAARDVVAAIETAGGRAEAFAWDGGEEDSAARLWDQIVNRLGEPEILIHAASPPIAYESVGELSTAHLRQYFRVQVESALDLVRQAIPTMEASGFGRVVFLGTSYLFGQPPAKMGAYIIAKSALWGLTRTLALELGPRKITVNMISPGMTVTDLTSDVPQRLKEVEARRVPARRLAVPEDAAALITFLVSAEAGYINGQNIPVTGGPI